MKFFIKTYIKTGYLKPVSEKFDLIICFIIFPILFFTYCNRDNIGTDQSVIQVNTEIPQGNKFYLKEFDITKLIDIDSLKTTKNNDHYQISFQVDEKGIYIFQDEANRFIPLIIDKNDTIKIKLISSGIDSKSVIDGNSETLIICEYLSLIDKQDSITHVLNEALLKGQQSNDFIKIRDSIMIQYDTMMLDLINSTLKLIDKEHGSIAALYLLNQQYKTQKLFPIEENFDLYIKIDSALQNKLPENKHSSDHHFRVINHEKEVQKQAEAVRNLLPGSIAPDIDLPDTSGNYIKLSSLRGKDILLYFWAADNAKSRQLNNTLIGIYNKIDKNRFEIYAVSLEENKKLWKNAINIDNMNWIHVSDNSNSNLQGTYLIEDIPTIYILDPEGKIISKNPDIYDLDIIFSSLLKQSK